MKLVQQQQKNSQGVGGAGNLLKPTPSPLPNPAVSLQLPGSAGVNSPRCPSPMLQPPASPRAVAPSPISKSAAICLTRQLFSVVIFLTRQLFSVVIFLTRQLFSGGIFLTRQLFSVVKSVTDCRFLGRATFATIIQQTYQ
jgi:hypothetical protein